MRRKMSVRARLAPHGKGAGVLINRLPMDLIRQIKKQSFLYLGVKGGHATEGYYRHFGPPHNEIQRVFSDGKELWFNANTGRLLSEVALQRRLAASKKGKYLK